jgi:hypothetical protein
MVIISASLGKAFLTKVLTRGNSLMELMYVVPNYVISCFKVPQIA